MLSQESKKQIDREVAKYPAEQKQSAVMAALAIAQMEKGWLSTETIEDVAGYLGMPAVAVYEVAKEIAEGRFHSGIHTLGLRESGIGYVNDGPHASLLPQDVKTPER